METVAAVIDFPACRFGDTPPSAQLDDLAFSWILHEASNGGDGTQLSDSASPVFSILPYFVKVRCVSAVQY